MLSDSMRKLLGRVADVIKFMSAPAPAVAWLVQMLIPRAAVVAVVGQSSALKSWFALFLAGCVATGSELCSGVACAKGTVFFFDFENGQQRLWRRVQTLWPNGLSVEEGAFTFFTMGEIGLADARFIEVFEALVVELGAPALVVFDTYRAATAGMDENDSASREVLDMLKALAEKHGSTFLVIHHTGKSGGTGLNAPRGSSAFTNALDALITMERPNPDVRASTLRLAKDRDGGREDNLVFRLEPGDTPCARVEVVQRTVEQHRQELDDLVLAAVTRQPGVKQSELALLTTKRKKDVGEALGRLVLANKVENPSRAAGYHPVESKEGVES